MIAEPAVKANRRVVNQRVLIVVQAQELPMIPDPQSPRHGKHWLDYPPQAKLQLSKSVEFL